jgi:transposase InsO family protein
MGVPSTPPVKKRRRRKSVESSPALSRDFERPTRSVTPEQKLLLIDAWKRSGLPGSDFADLVGYSYKTLYQWRRQYEKYGVEGLFGKPRGPERGSRVPPVTRRAILLIKEGNPEYGCDRISQLLYRGPGLGVSPGAVSHVLEEAGYEPVERPTERHPDKPRRFERAKPNALWQSDLFTFTIKRRRHRVHLVAFMDDHSRYITGFGLASSPTSQFILEVLRSAVGRHGLPEELLTDQGPQYHAWRGRTAFEKEVKTMGIRHILARPRHPQTLGKVERFWKSLWEECLADALFTDMEDARKRIAHYIDHFNFRRPHQGIDGLVPADRFFGAEKEIRETLEKRVAANALQIARSGEPAKPFYLSGRVGDQGLSVHAEGEKLILTTEGGARQEVSLEKPSPPPEAPSSAPPGQDFEPDEDPGPGASPLDGALKDLDREGLLPEMEVEHGEEE